MHLAAYVDTYILIYIDVVASVCSRTVWLNTVLLFDYRVLFNVMYTMVETLRWPNDNDSDEWKRLRENFRHELRESINYNMFQM